MEFTPKEFAEVPVGTFEQTACSPKPPDGDWNGVRIAAPREVRPAGVEKLVLPLCGYYLLPVLQAMDGEPMFVELVRASDGVRQRVAVAEEGGNEPEDPPPEDAPKASREALRGVLTGGYFNIDVQRYCAEALRADLYEIVVTYAGARSNAVQVRIVR